MPHEAALYSKLYGSSAPSYCILRYPFPVYVLANVWDVVGGHLAKLFVVRGRRSTELACTQAEASLP